MRPLTASGLVAFGLIMAGGCHDLQVVTNTYATRGEAQTSGAIDRGWIPSLLPAGAHDIREAHDEAPPGRRWGLFSFRPDDVATLRGSLGSEISFQGLRADAPPRIEWWPILLRGALDPAQLATTGLKGYSVPGDEQLVVAVNWNQRRAYYWSRR